MSSSLIADVYILNHDNSFKQLKTNRLDSYNYKYTHIRFDVITKKYNARHDRTNNMQNKKK